ncbi:MAG: S-layer homology domain-containing protein, partial [Acidimicrobiia bacterium]|nr:S-layer homology domain-containing protein [Acidimicrobiia bacterium]
MFASLSRFRRETAVLAVLALLASLLVVVPVSAADPKADHPAMYSACVGDAAESAGFTDVPAGHTNAGHIDCIAYYGITKGTSVDTYSPLMLVTREQMALFLTRLAGLVGIEVASDASHPFTDIGDLSEESQTAIGQLADLGITKGNNPSGTTYGPADPVQRDHMALFISRLMKKMTKGIGGATPDDVADSDSEDKSPFTDLGPTTKSAYDAITQLWELGVASGINDTHYGPAQSITRAAMAGFMAGVLDHSNARPAGLSIQAKTTSAFGQIDDPRVVVSYRDSMFAAMEGVAIAIFEFPGDAPFDDEEGTCPDALDCDWSENSDPTDTDGNIAVATDAVPDGTSLSVYAWMGDADNTDFALETANAVSVTVVSKRDANDIGVSTDANDKADGDVTAGTAAEGLLINLDADNSVTITAQLTFDEDPTAAPDAVAVAKSGQGIVVSMTQTIGSAEVYKDDSEATLTTDSEGKVTFTITGPSSTDKAGNDPIRDDVVRFTIPDGDNDSTNNIDATARVRWQDVARAPTNAEVSLGPAYQVIDDDGAISFRVTVRLYDQYGDPIGSGNADDGTPNNAALTVPGATPNPNRPVSRQGVATYSATVPSGSLTAGRLLRVEVEIPVTGGSPVTASETVRPLNHADDDSAAITGPVVATYADDNRFVIGGELFTYDSDDTFLIGSKAIETIEDFEKELEGLV